MANAAETMDLVVIPKETALDVFTAVNGLDPYMQRIRTEIDSFVPDTSTKKGRDAIASIAHKVARSKTYLDGCGKDLVAELKAIPAKVDAERKRMRDTLDAWKDEVRRPLTEWEKAEESRIAAHKQKIENINLRIECSDLDSSEIQANIDWLNSIVIDSGFEEFELEAAKAKAVALDALNAALVKRKAYEAEQAELARLRQEAAEREQKEREERIAREAAEAERARLEQVAQAEREAAAKREADAKAEAERREAELRLAAERAQREAIEAQRRAEIAAQEERARIQREKENEEAEAAAREKDKEHKKAINNKAVSDFIAGGMTEECAKLAVTLIAKKKISNISITY